MTLFAKVDAAGNVVEFPVFEFAIRQAFPNVSFPVVLDVAPEGYAVVEDTPAPQYNAQTHELVDAGVEKQGDKLVRVWNVTPLSAERLLEAAKMARVEAVSQITITSSAGNVFDGNEEAQGRMARALAAMDDGDTTQWVLADNSVVVVEKAELKEALRLAGAAQTAIWVAPYL